MENFLFESAFSHDDEEDGSYTHKNRFVGKCSRWYGCRENCTILSSRKEITMIITFEEERGWEILKTMQALQGCRKKAK